MIRQVVIDELGKEHARGVKKDIWQAAALDLTHIRLEKEFMG